MIDSFVNNLNERKLTKTINFYSKHRLVLNYIYFYFFHLLGSFGLILTTKKATTTTKTIKNLELAKTDVEATVQQQLVQIEHLAQVVAREQELRKQADKRTQIAIQKARQYSALRKAEEKRRIAAEYQTKKAVMRAREVMLRILRR